MKKIMLFIVILVTVIITGVLYGTHTVIIEERAAVSLEQVYMAQYPVQMPDVVMDPVTYSVF